MEQFISGTLYGVLCAAIPYWIYCRLRNKNRYKLMKVFFVVLIALFVMPLIKLLSKEELDILNVIVQIITIAIVIIMIRKIYSNDLHYKPLYQAISTCNMRVILEGGISMIDIEQIQHYTEAVYKANKILSLMVKKAYAYVSFENDCLRIELIIMNKKDMETLSQFDNISQCIYVKDIEYGKNGGSATIVIN